ncbi:MAG: NADPH:quinone oxidoreductase family protein [Burkholderiaceae bacterium]|nr:NADPH:quinone oxidoreductase family protein [Burkholderiaceae bacterium]
MRAIVCHETSGVDSLRLEPQWPAPAMAPGCVRVGIELAALNPPDCLMAQGKYQVSPALPFVPGIEGMGVVLEVAEGIDRLKPGDRVMTYAGEGCFGEEAVVKADYVHRLPQDVSAAAAAGFLLAYGTSHHGLVTRGHLRAGETVVVLGAAGGLGTSAIQIAKALGARVVAVASTDEKLAYCQDQGADFLINAKTDPIREKLQAFTEGRGADVVYDVVGGALTEVFLRGLAPYGRLLIAGYASGVIPSIKANLVLLKQAEVIGVSFRQYFQQRSQDAIEDVRHLCALWSSGRITPPEARVYPLEQAQAALRTLADGQALGKLALRVGPRRP